MSDPSLTASLDNLTLESEKGDTSKVSVPSNGISPSPLDHSVLFPSFPFTPQSGTVSPQPSGFPRLFGPSLIPPSDVTSSANSVTEPCVFSQPSLHTHDLSPGAMLGSGSGLPSSTLPQARTPSPFLSGPWSSLPGQNGGMLLSSEHHTPANSPATLPMNPTIRFGNSLPATLPGDADIIPTAIVIKNIPFNIKREQLLHVIRDLGIPVPYAFNYHFDQGIFRGLAFANFHSPTEATEVVNALNGLEVSGRKLRVEYKKVLQAGEKERIEKEKAMKRMQFSPYLDKERKKEKSPTFENATLHAHNPPMRGNSPSPGVSAPHRSSEPIPGFLFPRIPPQDPSDPALDLNDASTLEIYSRVLLFKDDRMRDELSFSKSLTAEERRVVHLVSHKLGLHHYTLGTGDDCFVLVTKTHMPHLGASDRLKPQDALSTFKSNHSAAPNDLLTKKSVPDMKRMMQNEHHRSSSPALMHRSAGLLTPCGSTSMARKSTCNPRDALSQAADPRFDGFGSFGGRSSHSQNLFAYPVDTPSVPYISHSNASGDVDSTDFVPSNCLPPLHRSRSPLHRVHSPMSTSLHSTPVTPLSQTMGPLDHAISPFGTVSSEPGLHQNSPVISDELLDNSPYPSAHSPVRPVFGDRPSLMLDINAIMMGQADDKPSTSLTPPKITTSSASDNP